MILPTANILFQKYFYFGQWFLQIIHDVLQGKKGIDKGIVTTIYEVISSIFAASFQGLISIPCGAESTYSSQIPVILLRIVVMVSSPHIRSTLSGDRSHQTVQEHNAYANQSLHFSLNSICCLNSFPMVLKFIRKKVP